jgi:integrase
MFDLDQRCTVKKIENEKIGIHDPFESHRKKPLSAHLDDWHKSLSSNGLEKDYVDLKLSRVRAVVEGCAWVFPRDMTADRLEGYLADMRNRCPSLPPMPEGTEWFTAVEVRCLLGNVSRQTISFMIRRHRLTAQGQGKARRFPRETVDALRGLKPGGCSSQTSNHYLQAMLQFARWMVANSRIDRSPFARLKPLNARLDTRSRRGEMTEAELSLLLANTATSEKPFLGLSGTDRAILCRVAVGTGFRAAELAALVPDHFDLNANQPAAILPAEFTKNRKGAVQPLSNELTAELRTYLHGRTGKKRVWPGRWAKRAADMIRIDLQDSGIPVDVDGPEGTETRDFHALRACFISNVIRAGADLKQAMTLARHSDPRLTAGRYARTRLHDLGAVVNKLPTNTPQNEAVALRMTGTHGNKAFPEQQRPNSGAAVAL